MRFHFGVSFRLRNLKKLIIPIILSLLAFFFGSNYVHAQDKIVINTESIEEYESLDNCYSNLSEYIDYFSNNVGDKYDFFVTHMLYTYEGVSTNSFIFYFIPNYSDSYSLYSINGTNDTELTSSENFLRYSDNVPPEIYRIYENSSFRIALTKSKCNNINFIDSDDALNDFDTLVSDYNTLTSDSSLFDNINNTNLTISNFPVNSSLGGTHYPYNIFLYGKSYTNEFFIYSSKSIIYKNDSLSWLGYNTDNLTFYPLILNGSLVNNGENLSFDYYPTNELDNFTGIKNIYAYTSFSNYKNVLFNINFNSIIDNYSSTTITPILYGRKFIDNGSYSFEKIDLSSCMWSSSITNNSINFDGISCNDTILSQYDYLSIKFKLNLPDTSYLGSSRVLYNLNYSYDTSLFSLFINEFKYNLDTDIYYPIILDSFSNPLVSTDFNFFISSYNSYTTYPVVYSNNKWLYFVPYNLDNFSMINPQYNEYMGSFTPYDFEFLQVGKDINRGIMILNDNQMNSSNYNISFFLNLGEILNINTTDNYCYYYDSLSCTIVDNQQFFDNNNESYDVENFFSIVTNFIDSISSDMANFGLIVQSFFDNIPSFIQTFIVVLFVLSNAYIIFKLIKR